MLRPRRQGRCGARTGVRIAENDVRTGGPIARSDVRAGGPIARSDVRTGAARGTNSPAEQAKALGPPRLQLLVRLSSHRPTANDSLLGSSTVGPICALLISIRTEQVMGPCPP